MQNQGSAYIADDCRFGDRVFVGPAAVILNDKYPPPTTEESGSRSTSAMKPSSGGNATIVPGNNVGERAVLAAVRVLTRPLPAGEVWGGNPAAFFMTREDYEARREA